MKVISRVEISKEELGFIDRVVALDCNDIRNCSICPLYLGPVKCCIKRVAKETLTKLNDRVE